MKKTKSSETPQNSLTYEDIEHVVEYLVKVKAHKETFDCWETEDIAQEIRIICLKVLPKFNAEKASDARGVVNYFGTCVDNRLKNVKRDNYIRFTPPFPKEVVKQVKENPEENPELYDKLIKFDQKLINQKKIKHPVSMDVIGDAKTEADNFEEEIFARDIKRHILENIEDNLRPALITILEGKKNQINLRVRKRIQESVRTILEE